MNKTIVSIEQVVDAVLVNFGEQLNAGALAKAINTAAAVLEIEKDGETYFIRQQMTTNYVKNGAVDGAKTESACGCSVFQTNART